MNANPTTETCLWRGLGQQYLTHAKSKWLQQVRPKSVCQRLTNAWLMKGGSTGHPRLIWCDGKWWQKLKNKQTIVSCIFLNQSKQTRIILPVLPTALSLSPSLPPSFGSAQHEHNRLYHYCIFTINEPKWGDPSNIFQMLLTWAQN